MIKPFTRIIVKNDLRIVYFRADGSGAIFTGGRHPGPVQSNRNFAAQRCLGRKTGAGNAHTDCRQAPVLRSDERTQPWGWGGAIWDGLPIGGGSAVAQ